MSVSLVYERMMKNLFWIGIVCLLTSCSTVNYIGIETYNPAEVTFPKHVGKVLVVNNAKPQPAETGYEFKLFGAIQDTCRAKADSALFDACSSLGKAIVEGGYFDDVLLYQDGVRKGGWYYTDDKLSPEQVKALCEETGTDAVVSLDRLLFDMGKNVVAYPEGYLLGDVNVRISGVVRSYIPGRPNSLATVYLTDSVFWSEAAGDEALLDKLLPSPEEALRTAGRYIGAKIAPNFVPHWETESRWYYGGAGARWKEASAYAASEKWEEAAERWDYLYAHESGWKSKAKAAANLALYNEINSKLEQAYEWALKSQALFKEHAGPNDNDARLLQLYTDALANRLRLDKKLNMQFDKE